MADVSSVLPVRGSSRSSEPPPVRRGQQALFWCAVALLSALGVFVLPFAFPPAIPTFSTSYTYGFNNRVAELFTVSFSAIVLLLLWRMRMGRTPSEGSPGERTPPRWLWFASLAAIVFTAVLGGCVVHANIFYSDASHFITQLGRVVRDHAALYRDVEFPYGPIFFYWAAAIQKGLALVGVSAAAAYMVTLASMQVLGLYMLFYILEWLPLTHRLRALALVLLTFGALTPLLGMNYTLLRFLLPHTLFLAIARCRSLAAQTILFVGAQVVALAFSPEIGAAFLGGVGCYALYRCFTAGWSWIAAAAAPLAAAGLFIAITSKDYFSVMHHFAVGAFNLVVMPEYHILILLIAAIALSPIAVAGYLQTRDPRAASMFGFYIISLGMIAPSLGRCDPLHTFFGGLGVYLLSLVAVSGLTTKRARIWVVALSLFIVGYQVDDLRVYRALMVRVIPSLPTRDDRVDVARLEALTHGQRIAAPIMIPESVHQELIRRGQFQPSYFVYMGGVWDDASEQRKIAELRQAPFALISNKPFQVTHPDFEASRISRLFRLGFRYHPRFAPWVQGAALAHELREHWTPIESVGDFTLYRQNGK